MERSAAARRADRRPSRLVARIVHRGRLLEDRLDHGGCGIEEVLAVVENQGVGSGRPVRRRCYRPSSCPGCCADAEHRRDRLGYSGRDRRQGRVRSPRPRRRIRVLELRRRPPARAASCRHRPGRSTSPTDAPSAPSAASVISASRPRKHRRRWPQIPRRGVQRASAAGNRLRRSVSAEPERRSIRSDDIAQSTLNRVDRQSTPLSSLRWRHRAGSDRHALPPSPARPGSVPRRSSHRPARSASPVAIPIRTGSSSAAARRRRHRPRHRGDEKAAHTPSPVCLNSQPSCAATVARISSS